MSIVRFPFALDAIWPEAASAGLRDPAAQLSVRYREGGSRAVLLDQPGKRAYVTARMPATYAAIWTALSRLLEAAPDFAPRTLLDAGCGPGTASLAAAGIFGTLEAVTQSDLDPLWRPVAQRIGNASGHAFLQHPRWLSGRADSVPFPNHDLIVAGFALNEVAAETRTQTVENLWAATDQALLLVEPGTPVGFTNIAAARDTLLRLGAFLTAPCPHHAACPMSAQDWCHNSVRLSRSAAHREAKGARLPYEDEKFSYLAVTRHPPSHRPDARIVKRPAAHRGHVQLDLCTEDGLARHVVARSEGGIYKSARDAAWGDSWPPHLRD